MVDIAKQQTDELNAVMARISEYAKRAQSRREAYANSNFADMPAWDRMLIEMIIDTHKQMDVLKAELADFREMFTPAPDMFVEKE